MKEIRLTIYDWIAYLIPGTIVVWAAWELFKIAGYRFPKLAVHNLPVAAQLFLILIICYSIGHALHAIANLTIDLLPFGGYPPRNYFQKHFEKHFNKALQKALLSGISTHFGIAATNRQESPTEIIKNSYWSCYTFVAQAKADSLSQIFLSITGFYRGMSVGVFLIALGYLMVGLVLKKWVPIFIAIVAILIGFLFLRRVTRFKGYLTRTVYSDFLSVIGRSIGNEIIKGNNNE